MKTVRRIRDRLFGGEANGVFRGMMTLVMGTGTARLIGVLAIPLLTRIYSPADYGVLSVYAAMVAVVAPLLTLRYVLALPLPRTDAMATNLLVLSGLLLLGMTALAASMLWAVGEVILGWMSMEVLAPWWWLVVLGALFAAVYESMSLWATRQRAYGVIARTKVLQSALGEGTKLILGLAGFKPFGLLFGHLLEQGGGSITFFVRFWQDIKSNLRSVRKRHLCFLASHYRGFPAFRLPSQFLLAFSTQAPAMFSAALYGAAATGQLGLALMALAIPANLIGQAAGQAFYGEIARLKKGSEVRIQQLAHAVQKRLFLVGIPASAGIFFLGEPVFKWAFGPEWAEAGTYASALAPFVLLQLTSAPLIQILNIYKAQAAFLAINVFRTIGLVVIYQVCRLLSLPPLHFVYLLSAFLFIFYLLISLYILRVVRNAAARSRVRLVKQG